MVSRELENISIHIQIADSVSAPKDERISIHAQSVCQNTFILNVSLHRELTSVSIHIQCIDSDSAQRTDKHLHSQAEC
jgi:hypothetical protein